MLRVSSYESEELISTNTTSTSSLQSKFDTVVGKHVNINECAQATSQKTYDTNENGKEVIEFCLPNE